MKNRYRCVLGHLIDSQCTGCGAAVCLVCLGVENDGEAICGSCHEEEAEVRDLIFGDGEDDYLDAIR